MTFSVKRAFETFLCETSFAWNYFFCLGREETRWELQTYKLFSFDSKMLISTEKWQKRFYVSFSSWMKNIQTEKTLLVKLVRTELVSAKAYRGLHKRADYRDLCMYANYRDMYVQIIEICACKRWRLASNRGSTWYRKRPLYLLRHNHCRPYR